MGRLFLFLLLIILGICFHPLCVISENMKPEEKGEERILSPAEKLDEIKDKVFLMIKVEKEQVYVNEISSLWVKLFVSGFSIKDIQYPKFSHRAFLTTGFDQPLQKTERVKDVLFDTWEFKMAIFSQKPGDYFLGPTELRCVLQGREGGTESFHSKDQKEAVEDYFGRYETLSLNLKSEKIKIRVMPFPIKGRPVDFNGAVGNFHFKMEAHPKEARVGNPITLRMIIEGKGNFSAVTAPTLKRTDDFKIYKPQIIQKDGLKIFEQVLLPQTEVKEVPEASFSFFNPDKKVYLTLLQGPLPIKVVKLEKNVVQGEKEVLGRDILFIKDSPGKLIRKGDFLYKNSVFLLTQLLAILLFISFLLLNRQRERMRTDVRYAGKRRASKRAKKGLRELERMIKEGKSKEFYDILFKTLQVYLGDKFQIPSGGITGETVDQALRAKEIDKKLCGNLKNIFEECDQARYGSLLTLERSKMEEIFLLMKETIRRLEIERL